MSGLEDVEESVIVVVMEVTGVTTVQELITSTYESCTSIVTESRGGEAVRKSESCNERGESLESSPVTVSRNGDL